MSEKKILQTALELTKRIRKSQDQKNERNKKNLMRAQTLKQALIKKLQ